MLFLSGFLPPPNFLSLFHCVAKFINSRNDDKSSHWNDSRSSSWSNYANLRFVHLFIVCCFFRDFYHQLILFFLFHCVAKFPNSRNGDKSSCWDDSRSSSWIKYANLVCACVNTMLFLSGFLPPTNFLFSFSLCSKIHLLLQKWWQIKLLTLQFIK